MELIVSILLTLLVLCGAGIFAMMWLMTEVMAYSSKMLALKESRIKILEEIVNRTTPITKCKVCNKRLNKDDIARDCCDKCLR